MKKPAVTVIKKYLASLNKIKAKYITSERLSKVLGVYPELINETLSYFEPMLLLDYSYNLLDLKPTLEAYVSDDENKRTPITTGEVITKRILSQYSSIHDFIYQKMSIAGMIDKNAYLSDADLRALKRLIQEEQARRKKK
jgi:NADH/NAD ratio-sensing transcriptional regulator Rex